MGWAEAKGIWQTTSCPQTGSFSLTELMWLALSQRVYGLPLMYNSGKETETKRQKHRHAEVLTCWSSRMLQGRAPHGADLSCLSAQSQVGPWKTCSWSMQTSCAPLLLSTKPSRQEKCLWKRSLLFIKSVQLHLRATFLPKCTEKTLLIYQQRYELLNALEGLWCTTKQEYFATA